MNLNATVQASAGSGKTYLLINRLVRLLLLGAEPATILAITFTRKAATEMQYRLLEKVYELSCAGPDELERMLNELNLSTVSEKLRLNARQLYEQLLHSTQPLKATTFHAFCQDILRRFPLEADVPPGFELVEQTRTLQHQAVEALMVEVAQDDSSDLFHALTWLLDNLGLYTTTATLNTFIEQRSEWWAYTQTSNNALEYATTNLKSQLHVDEGSEPFAKFFNHQPHLIELEQFARLLELHPTKTNLEHARILSGVLNTDLDLTSRFDAIWLIFFTAKNEPRARKSSAAQQKKMGVDKEEVFLSLHTLYCDKLQQVQNDLNTLFTFNMNKAWYTAGSHALALFQRYKLEQRLLDFSDLEWKTYKLLNHGDNAQWVQYKLDARINHLLIDEFQDTNPTQWHLISPLLEEIASQQESLRSVFLVGDAKQSIYRFRRAEPRLFDYAEKWMESSLKAETIPLHKSWRSAPAIISFINTTFGSGALNQQLTEFIPHEVHYIKRWGKVSMLPLVNEPDNVPEEPIWRNPLQQPRSEKIAVRYQMEANQIAQMIIELTSNNLIGDEENARPVRYSDIIILLRNRNHITEYEQALRHANIPYIGDARGTLLKSLEIADLVNLLQWLNMPQDDLALAGILRSPLFSVTDNDLILLANTSGRFWHDRLLSLRQTLSNEHPLSLAITLLEQWRSLADHIPVHDLLDHIYSSGNVLARFAASYPLHQRDRVIANLNGFIELALDMDSGRYPSLLRFIQWLKELYTLDNDAPDEPVSGQSSDRVRLLTIHAAKGLEAPVVFLADATHKAKAGNAYSVLLNWPLTSKKPDTFILVPPVDNQEVFSRSLIDLKQRDDSREEANLLYVALTRSCQLLYISGNMSTTRKYTGWYGQIAQQYDLDPMEITEPHILEESNRPPLKPAEIVKVDSVINKPDPRLSQPLVTKKVFHEIAPSKMVDEYVLHESKQSETARLRGIIIHAMLDKLSQNSKIELTQFLSRPDMASLTGGQTQETLESYWQEACKIVVHEDFVKYFNVECYDKALNEVPIIYNKDDLTVHGIIDRLVIKRDSIIFIDYKSHTHVNSDNAEEIATTYVAQMQYYKEGLARIWPDKDITSIVVFTHCAIAIELKI